VYLFLLLFNHLFEGHIVYQPSVQWVLGLSRG